MAPADAYVIAKQVIQELLTDTGRDFAANPLRLENLQRFRRGIVGEDGTSIRHGSPKPSLEVDFLGLEARPLVRKLRVSSLKRLDFSDAFETLVRFVEIALRYLDALSNEYKLSLSIFKRCGERFASLDKLLLFLIESSDLSERSRVLSCHVFKVLGSTLQDFQIEHASDGVADLLFMPGL
jgi:hypothetical protein